MRLTDWARLSDIVVEAKAWRQLAVFNGNLAVCIIGRGQPVRTLPACAVGTGSIVASSRAPGSNTAVVAKPSPCHAGHGAGEAPKRCHRGSINDPVGTTVGQAAVCDHATRAVTAREGGQAIGDVLHTVVVAITVDGPVAVGCCTVVHSLAWLDICKIKTATHHTCERLMHLKQTLQPQRQSANCGRPYSQSLRWCLPTTDWLRLQGQGCNV